MLIMKKTLTRISFALFLALLANAARAGETNNVVSTNWLSQPLSLADALNTTLQQSSTILKAKSDLEAAYGVVVQTRAILIPKVNANGNYTDNDPNSIDRFPFGGAFTQPHESWNAGIQIVQSFYEGGRMASALRTAKLTKEQAILQYQTAVADTLLSTRVAYYGVLLAQQQITVREASVGLLSKEFSDQQSRFDAGTVPRFNVLRAEVAVANARPPLIRARNAYRIAKNNLVNLLGHNLPRDVWEDIPLQLTDKLEAEPYKIELPAALMQAYERRTELAGLRKAEGLRKESITLARAGYKPSIQGFAGWGWRNSGFTTDLSREVDGWSIGAQLNWDIFDGFLTRGKVMEAKALHEKSLLEIDDTARRIDLEVRTAYSTFLEAKEVLDSQKKVQEQAEEALRLARARTEAGSGTQLEVLDAQTSLTEARTTQVEALHDYVVARARLERAIGPEVVQPPKK